MRKYGLFLFIILLASFFMISLETSSVSIEQMNLLEVSITTITAPFQRSLIQTFNVIPELWNKFKIKEEGKEEIINLKQEIGRLAQQLEYLRNQQAENEQLKALLSLSATIKTKQVAAEVVSRSPTNWFHLVTVNKGKAQGVEVGMAALDKDGLAGRVIQIGPHFARVMLLLDPNNAIPVQLTKSRALGILYGTGKTTCEMRYISHESKVEIGDTVVTSGYGRYFPKGLLIGTVTKVSHQEHALFKTATIKPRVSFGSLEFLLLVKKEEVVNM